MIPCPLDPTPMRRTERAAKRLAQILTRKGPKHRVRACGDHFHVYPDPLSPRLPDLDIPRPTRWRRT